MIKYLKNLMYKIEKLQAKLVIFLIGEKIELNLYRGTGDHGEKTVGVVEMYSGVYYGIWEVETRNDWVIEATFRRF